MTKSHWTRGPFQAQPFTGDIPQDLKEEQFWSSSGTWESRQRITPLQFGRLAAPWGYVAN